MTEDIQNRKLGRVELQTCYDDKTVFDELWNNKRDLMLGFHSTDNDGVDLDNDGVRDELAKLGFEDSNLGIIKMNPRGFVLKLYDHDRQAVRALNINPGTIHVREEVADLLPQSVFRALIVSCNRRGLVPGKRSRGYSAGLVEFIDYTYTPDCLPLPWPQGDSLGLGKNVLEFLNNATKRLGLQAIVTAPWRFHNALYCIDEFKFIDPVFEGRFQALVRDCKHLMAAYNLEYPTAIAAATWACAEGHVKKNGQAFNWFCEPMVVPTADLFESLTTSKWYQNEVKQVLATESFSFDIGPLFQRLSIYGIHPFDEKKIWDWLNDPSRH